MSIPMEAGKVFNKTDDRGTFAHFHPPFDIKRMYFIEDFDTDTIRGMHAHDRETKAFYIVKGAIILVTVTPKEQSSHYSGPKDEIVKMVLTPHDSPTIVHTGSYTGLRTLIPGTIYCAMSDKSFDPTDDRRLDPENYREYFTVKNR